MPTLGIIVALPLENFSLAVIVRSLYGLAGLDYKIYYVYNNVDIRKVAEFSRVSLDVLMSRLRIGTAIDTIMNDLVIECSAHKALIINFRIVDEAPVSSMNLDEVISRVLHLKNALRILNSNPTVYVILSNNKEIYERLLSGLCKKVDCIKEEIMIAIKDHSVFTYLTMACLYTILSDHIMQLKPSILHHRYDIHTLRELIYLARKVFEGIIFFENTPIIEPSVLIYVIRKLLKRKGIYAEGAKSLLMLDFRRGQLIEKIYIDLYDGYFNFLCTIEAEFDGRTLTIEFPQDTMCRKRAKHTIMFDLINKRFFIDGIEFHLQAYTIS